MKIKEGKLQYKGYSGSVKLSVEDDVLHGKIEGIRSLITYEGNTFKELNKNFIEAVEEYLKICEELGI